jgi:murein hydrolase activator
MLRRRALAGLILLLALAAPALAVVPGPAAEREAAARAELGVLRAEIAALQASQHSLDGERNAAARELRAADQALAATAGTLRATEASLAERDAELAVLQQRRAELDAGLDSQRAALAGLLRAAYALGRHQQLKLLLAQDEARRVGRALAYQRYFQRARMQQIDALRARLTELAALQEAIGTQQQRLAAARLDREAARSALEAEREQARQVLAALEARQRDARGRLAALGRDEAALLKLIGSLQDVFADIPRQLAGGEPLAQQRGRLARPLGGRLRVGFGGRLPDGRPSKGWLIEGGNGSPVRAIAHGRVAFADWMKGYGLLLILDHGDGFMSLYAANESLLKEIGDWVPAGEPVAAVGASGGQAEPGLYFELRRHGRPIDPKGWLRP